MRSAVWAHGRRVLVGGRLGVCARVRDRDSAACGERRVLIARDAVGAHALRVGDQRRLHGRGDCWLALRERAAETSPRQELKAAWKAGDCVLIVVGMAIPPIELYSPLMLAPGSGKLERPCSRMHLANARACTDLTGDLVALAGELPAHRVASRQAAITPSTDATPRAPI